jgi:hypothetical protein
VGTGGPWWLAPVPVSWAGRDHLSRRPQLRLIAAELQLATVSGQVVLSFCTDFENFATLSRWSAKADHYVSIVHSGSRHKAQWIFEPR